VAELPEDIDADRARKSMERAKERIEAYKAGGEGRDHINLLRAEASLQRALARLKALGTKGGRTLPNFARGSVSNGEV
jgi:F-type H+-transporting ATPase subunit epsilon